MTNEELLAKIKAEIERLEKENCINSGEHFCMRRALCLGRLNQIISESQQEQMKSEKPIEQDELEEELDFQTFAKEMEAELAILKPFNWEYKIARYFAKWGAEHLKK